MGYSSSDISVVCRQGPLTLVSLVTLARSMARVMEGVGLNH